MRPGEVRADASEGGRVAAPASARTAEGRLSAAPVWDPRAAVGPRAQPARSAGPAVRASAAPWSWPLLLAFAVYGSSFFHGLGAVPLFDVDEGRIW